VLDGGMELNARPLLYGSRHPFYMVSRDGALLSSEFYDISGDFAAVPVGRCCESGDAQSLTPDGLSLPRRMAAPDVGDFAVIGGAGAYCSSMAPMNYNSHVQAAEILCARNGQLVEIRRQQTLEQLVANEL
jgi:diaminopimelate decarboxylase